MYLCFLWVPKQWWWRLSAVQVQQPEISLSGVAWLDSPDKGLVVSFELGLNSQTVHLSWIDTAKIQTEQSSFCLCNHMSSINVALSRKNKCLRFAWFISFIFSCLTQTCFVCPLCICQYFLLSDYSLRFPSSLGLLLSSGFGSLTQSLIEHWIVICNLSTCVLSEEQRPQWLHC